jgi:hypothetical protein
LPLRGVYGLRPVYEVYEGLLLLRGVYGLRPVYEVYEGLLPLTRRLWAAPCL